MTTAATFQQGMPVSIPLTQKGLCLPEDIKGLLNSHGEQFFHQFDGIFIDEADRSVTWLSFRPAYHILERIMSIFLEQKKKRVLASGSLTPATVLVCFVAKITAIARFLANGTSS